MQKMIIIAGFLVGVLTSSVRAEPVHVIEVKVKGLVCSFCVQGVEKLLKDLPGVKKLDIKLSKQTVFMTISPKDGPDDASIRRAVKAAGYDVDSIHRPGRKKKAADG
jgi:mercuric ion binding protein